MCLASDPEDAIYKHLSQPGGIVRPHCQHPGRDKDPRFRRNGAGVLLQIPEVSTYFYGFFLAFVIYNIIIMNRCIYIHHYSDFLQLKSTRNGDLLWLLPL